MAAADDRLVSVVGAEIQPAPRKDERENVPSGSDPLAVLAANADCEINFVHYAGTGFCSSPRKFAAPDVNKQAKAREEGPARGHLPDTPFQSSPRMDTN